MKKGTVVLVFGLLISIISGYSQTIRWAKGKDLKFLDGQKTLKVVIMYDSMTFDNGKSEKDYQAEVAKGYNAEKPGKGDDYLERWKTSKGADGVFIRRFMEKFEGQMRKIDIKADPDAKGNKYVLLVYPLAVTPGAPSYIGKRGAPAYTDFRFIIAEEANPKNVVASVFIYQVPGMLIGKDFDLSFIGRFKNCFMFGGISLGKEMVKIKRG